MTPDIFSTESLPRRDQFEAWREWFQGVLEVIPKHPTGDGFSAENKTWKLAGLAMSRTSGPPVRVVRTRNHLRRDPVDHWILSYCIRGAHFTKTPRGSLEVPARASFLWSLGKESAYERTHADQIQFFMSRDTFRDIAPLLDAALGSVLDTPLGQLLGDYMIALERRLPALIRADFPRLSSAVAAMVAAAVVPSVERVAIAKQQIDLGRMERVRQAVRRHLRTPGLTPATLCRLVGMSRSNLYRLFEEVGGVAQYIHRERLLEARAVLSDPAQTQSIAVIAEDLCFADASSFSRAFKREFGYTPGETVSAALAGVDLGAAPMTRAPSETAHFGHLLRGF